MDVSVIVSKKTLNQLDQFLNYHHNHFVKKLEEKHQVSLQSYLRIENKIKKKNLVMNLKTLNVHVWLEFGIKVMVVNVENIHNRDMSIVLFI